jgi:hypothetical protein
MVSVFVPDEATHVALIKGCLDDNTLKIDFGYYGHLYFYLCLLPLFVVKLFMPVSEHLMIVVLRVVSILFGAATIVAVFITAKRYVGQYQAWVAAAILCIVPFDFLRLSSFSHPDTVQMFFITLSLLCCCRMAEDDHLKWLAFASVTAGLAFACKYSGMFLIPVIATVVVLSAFKARGGANQEGFGRYSLLPIRVALLLSGLLGLTAAILMNPRFVETLVGIDLSTQGLGVSKASALSSLRLMAGGVGVFLLLIGLLPALWNYLARFSWVVLSLRRIGLSLVLFAAAFVAVSPFSFYRLSMVRLMLYESTHTSFGDWFAETESGLAWFGILASEQVVGPIILAVLALGLIVVLWHISRKGLIGALEPTNVMWFWIVFFLFFLILRVYTRPARYALPIVPAMVVVFVAVCSTFLEFVRQYWGRMRCFAVIPIVFWMIFFAFEGPSGLRRITDYREYMSLREMRNPAIRAGTWLQANYPSSTRIFYDYYSYVPPIFKHAQSTYGGTWQVAEKFDPDIIIVHKKIFEKFADRGRSAQYGWGTGEFLAIHTYYSRILNGKSEYRQVNDFGSLRIYERQAKSHRPNNGLKESTKNNQTAQDPGARDEGSVP